MSRTSDDRWDERLACFVVSLAYDFRSRTGRLVMIDGNCCDMRGCVAIFEGIDPEVVMIETYAGGKRDTIYRKEGKDWRAFFIVESAKEIARMSMLPEVPDAG